MTLLKELIEIPDHVYQDDFVLKLTSGIEHPAQTLSQYEVTPQLAKCFDEALSLVQSALESRSSKAAYLHGSFGAGKSHFMAVLHLLLQHEPAARSLPGLSQVVAKHDHWLKGRKFLRVPYHLLGATSLEAAILGHYVSFVRKLHPNAPIPAVYLAEPIFENAKHLRAQLGDAKFFAELNGGANHAPTSEWGGLVAAWDPANFEAALRSAPLAPDEEKAASSPRTRLVSDLVERLLPAFQDVAAVQGERYVAIDQGLAIVSQHAQALGYDAVVFFLDELILWLAMNVSDTKFIQREVQKFAKLVESQQAGRPIPIVSFVARQRDLRELIGDHVPGAEKLGFHDTLKWNDGRFQVIKLEDRNLPAIAEKRVLKPKSEAARQLIDQAFERTTKVRQDVLDTLLAKNADPKMFRQVYPFSPALVDVLVAVSSLLQRERTALKIMVQLLFERREWFELGQLIPVGDLYDSLLEGNDPITADARQFFDESRKLYRTKLQPLLDRIHGVTAEMAKAAPPSDMKAKQFRADDGLLKTLLLAALVPECPVLKDLTPARLAALNHGTITSPIAGQETQLVLKRVRDWAAQVGEIRITGGPNDPNPVITLQVSGVDTATILDKVASEDNKGNRMRKLRALLFESMGVQDRSDLFSTQFSHGFVWRGSERAVDIVFQNIRELPDESFRNGKPDWKLVIDFPFDDDGFSWADDVTTVKAFRAKNASQRTVCWIPTFFTREVTKDLGQLVKLDHLLTSDDRFRNATSHLAPTDRPTARAILDSQRSALTERMRGALLAAYGVAPGGPAIIEQGHEPGEMIRSLAEGFSPKPPVGATLADALSGLLEQMLANQFPAHPAFEQPIKAATWRRVKEILDHCLDEPSGRVEVPKESRAEMRDVAQRLKLGTMHEAHFVHDRHWRDLFDREAGRAGGDVTVRRLREFIDKPTPMGLETKAQNLIILDYAVAANRVFLHHGGVVPPTLDKIDDEWVLKEQALPDEGEWAKAIDLGARLFGIPKPALRNASNVVRFAAEAMRNAQEYRDASRTLVERLPRLLRDFDVEEPKSTRLQSARAAATLLDQLAAAPSDKVARVLASAMLPTSPEAVGRAIKGAPAMVAAIQSTKWTLLDALKKLTDDRATAAAGLRKSVAEVLTADEFARALAPELARCEQEATLLLADVRPAGVLPPPPPPPPVITLGRPTEPVTPLPNRQRRSDLDVAAARRVFEEIERALRSDAKKRATIEWEIGDGSERKSP